MDGLLKRYRDMISRGRAVEGVQWQREGDGVFLGWGECERGGEVGGLVGKTGLLACARACAL